MHNILTVYNKISISCKVVLLTSQKFINLLPAIELLTDGLIFIGSLSYVILTSQCPGVVQILVLGRQGYCKHLKNSYRLASWTTAVLFDPWTDMLAKAADPFSGQTNCCYPRIQSITVKYWERALLACVLTLCSVCCVFTLCYLCMIVMHSVHQERIVIWQIWKSFAHIFFSFSIH